MEKGSSDIRQRSRLSAAHQESVQRQWKLWGGLAALLAFLLTFFHLGFFFYLVIVAIGLFGVSWALASTGIEGVQVSRTVSREEAEAGEELEVCLTLKNDKGLPIPWLYWEEQLDGGLVTDGPDCGLSYFRPREIRDLIYRLPLPRRGLFRIGPAVLEASGPFGLVRRFHVGQDASFVTVFPRVVPLTRPWPPNRSPVHQVPRRRSLFEDPTRFVGTREYQPSDGRRRVHWRATARVGRLQSRVYEPSVLGGALLVVDMQLASFGNARGAAPTTRTSAERADIPGNRYQGNKGEGQASSARADLPDNRYQVNKGEGSASSAREDISMEGHPLVELSVTTAASLAEFILGGGQKVGLFSNGADAAERYPSEWSGETFRQIEGILAETAPMKRNARKRPVEVEAAKGSWQRDRLMTALARLVPSEGLSLAALLVAELPRLPRSLVLKIVSASPTAELGRAMGILRRSGLDVTLVWVGADPSGPLRRAAIPEGIPIFPVPNEASLAQLGVFQL